MKTITICMPSTDYVDPNIPNLQALGFPQAIIDESPVNRTSITGRSIEPDLKAGEEFTSSKVVGSVTYMYLNVASLRVGIKYDLEDLIRREVITSYSVKN